MNIKKFVKIFKKYEGILEDSIFPPRCPVCKKIVDNKNYGICKTCLGKLKLIKSPFCMQCGKHIEDDTDEYCDECLLNPKSYEKGFPLLRYDSLSSSIMYDIKYNNKKYYARVFARMIYTVWGKEIKKLNIDCIIPIPIHKKRLKQRGYNQAEILAAYLSEYLKINLENEVLSRVKNTKAQKELNPKERIKNLKEAFIGNIEYKNYFKNVLLVDDIYTTGATIEACTRSLKAIGVEKVYYTSICIG